MAQRKEFEPVFQATSQQHTSVSHGLRKDDNMVRYLEVCRDPVHLDSSALWYVNTEMKGQTTVPRPSAHEVTAARLGDSHVLQKKSPSTVVVTYTRGRSSRDKSCDTNAKRLATIRFPLTSLRHRATDPTSRVDVSNSRTRRNLRAFRAVFKAVNQSIRHLILP